MGTNRATRRAPGQLAPTRWAWALVPALMLGSAWIAHRPGPGADGGIVRTDHPMDTCIEGAGLFQVVMAEPHASVAYTRDGRFRLNADRELVMLEGGHVLLPNITFPEDVARVRVTERGEVLVWYADDEEAMLVGELELATFAAPENLLLIGPALWCETAHSGAPDIGQPASVDAFGSARGTIRAGAYESCFGILHAASEHRSPAAQITSARSY